MTNIPTAKRTFNPRTAASIISGCDGSPDTGMCKCPSHDDEHASLHVSEKNGRVLFKCHAGCSQQSVIAALKARGLWSNGKSETKRPDDWMSEAHQDAARFRQAFIILRAAAYAEAGQPVEYLKRRGIDTIPSNAMLLPAAQSRQLTGKGFPAMVLPIIKNNKLVGAHLTWLCLDGSKKLPVKNPRRIYGPYKGGYVQLGNPDRDQPLIVAEGVETALSASQLTGLPAIAALSATNMPAVIPPRCSEVIIAADNDNPGREAANMLKQNLTGYCKGRIAIPDGPEKYDWNDALNSGTDHAELGKAILSAKAVKTTGVRSLSAEQYMEVVFPERPFLLSPWLKASSLSMIHAQRGDGKTFLALSIAYAIATGKPLLDWVPERAAKVLYVDGEMPGDEFQGRLKLLEAPSPNLRILSQELFVMRGAAMPDLSEERGQTFLDREIEREGIDVIILDSISTLMRSGVENDAESWAPVQDWMLKHRSRGRTIILLHHQGRSGNPRGTSKREDTLDTVISLKGCKDLSTDQTSVFELNFTKSRGFHGDDAAAKFLHMSTESGKIEWSHERKESTSDRVADLVKQGLKQKDIANELDVSESLVSKLVKRMKAVQT